MPDLAVILVVGERRDRAVRALASVLDQDVVSQIEVLLLDCAPGDPPPLPGSDHPVVRTVRLPADTLFSAAKARAVRMAAAPVVAFVEEHCRVFSGWAEALIEAHRGPWAGVGAEVHIGNPDVPISHLVAVINYHPWLPPARRAEHDMLPGHNSSFKRDLLLAYGEELEDLLRAEIVLHGRLRRDGHRLLLEPAARFAHINESSLRSIAEGRFLWNRCYGPSRARTFGWSAGRRLFYAVATPLIPLYALAKITRTLSRTRPELLPTVQAWIPQFLFAHLATAAGQALGLLFGRGSSEARFTLFELNEARETGDVPTSASMH
jgi:GT2 family glycosyltransferase